MPIEESLGRIATALETLAAATGAAPVANNDEAPAKRRRGRKPAGAAGPDTPPAAPAAPAETPEPEGPMVTRDQVREALRIFRKSNTKAEAIEVLEAHGAVSVTKADESRLPALLKAFSV